MGKFSSFFTNSILIILLLVTLLGVTNEARAQKGADISWATEMEASGYTWYDACGEQNDIYDILKAFGVEVIRLRVWVNPGNGWCGTNDVVNKAIRAKNAGLQIMLSFHYSDTWADPGNQTKPSAWSALSFNELMTQVYNYTYDVMTTMVNNGVAPDYAQVGNETNNGMLWPDGMASENMQNYAWLVNCGYNAIKAVNSSTQVIVHISNGWDNDLFVWNIGGLLDNGANFDIIGMSIYPDQGESTSMLGQLVANANNLISRYGKSILVVEVGMGQSYGAECKTLISGLLNQVGSAFYWEPEAYNWNGYLKGAFFNDGTPNEALEAFGGSGCVNNTSTTTTTTAATTTTTTTGGASVTIQENETGFCNVDGTIDNNNSGFTGDGFANTANATGNGIDWKINVSASGTYTFTWRYANGSSNRPGNLLINGSTVVSNISFSGTGSWTSWTTVSTNTTLSTGLKDVRLEATTSGGLANIDYIGISGGNVAAASCNTTTTTTAATTTAATTTTTTTTTGMTTTTTAATTTTTTSGGGCTCPSLCGSSTAISIPFSQNGAGEYCWVTSDNIGYINSWGLEELNINGQDFTNQWANSFPAKINGNYYIYYQGYNGWSHFEASSSAWKKNTETHSVPTEFALYQNYPNPFNPVTNISYQLPEEGDVLLEIFDLQGHKVKTLVNGRQNAGAYTTVWHSLNGDEKRVTSGIYVYRLKVTAENRIFSQSMKMALLK